MTVNIYVNGYGAPEDPVNDENLERYLGEVKRLIESYRFSTFVLYLAGGFTNRTDLSEAQAMQMWFEHHGLPENLTKIILIEESTTGRDNIALFSRIVNHDETMIFFWEYSRRFHMKFFVRRFFGKQICIRKFIGVKFDARSMKPINLLKSYFLKFPLLVLSWYFPFIDKYIIKPIRKRHVEKCRKERIGS